MFLKKLINTVLDKSAGILHDVMASAADLLETSLNDTYKTNGFQ